MCPPSLFPCLLRWLLLMAVVSGGYPLAAQTPIPDGSDRHPSAYVHPVLTWDRSTPVYRSNEGRLRLGADITDKLQSIVIPQIEFRRTTLADAVEYLRQESRRLDPDPDPARRGVDIVLQLPASGSPATNSLVPDLPFEPTPPLGAPPQGPANQQTRITLTMSKLPLFEALGYLAHMAGLKLKVQSGAVYIVPPDSPMVMARTEYQVPPELFGSTPELSIAAKSWFETKGVTFPPGSSATYTQGTHRLVMRNTQENLDKVAAAISSSLKTADPTPTDP